MTVAYAPCYFLSLYNFQKKEVIFIYYISVQEKEELWDHIFWRVLLFHYECYFDDKSFPFHTHYRKKCFVQLYNDDTVEVHYKVKVDNVISIFFHNNN